MQYYSMNAVAAHNSRFDCWYVLYDMVWDFTSYVDQHPGGARRVFEHCGTDATVAYAAERKHNINLLYKETPNLFLGMLGSRTEIQYNPC